MGEGDIVSRAPRLLLMGRVLSGGRGLDEASVFVEDGRVAWVRPGRAKAPGAEPVGGPGVVIAPGFIDLQVNGFGGYDACDGPDAIIAIARGLVRTGVTAFLPTAITAPLPSLAKFVIATATAAKAAGPDAARVLGAHVEGPFLDRGHHGAHDPALMLDPTPERVDQLLTGGLPRLVTMAPELPGALDAAARLSGLGVVVSAGHSGATLDQARAAFAGGFRLGTHLFNAMSGVHHRQPGLALALLESRVPAGLILDGVHVDPAVAAMAIRLKGARGIALTTDQAAPAGEPPGRFKLGGTEVVSDGKTVRRADGTLAGSASTMDHLVRTAAALPGVGLGRALAMATATPARVLGLGASRARVAAGSAADLVLLDEEGSVRVTLIGGRIAYRR